MYLDYALLAAGLAMALVLQRAVLAWSDGPPAGVSKTTLEMRPLAWQTAARRPIFARAFAAAALVLVALATSRFEGTEAARVAVIGLALLTCAATDFLAYRVPDAITLPALAFALAMSAVFGQPPVVSALAASVIAGGLLLFAAVLTRGGLGGGDVKLGALIGAALGLPWAAFALAVGIVAGGLVVIALYATGRLEREQAFPFAPFLALAGLAFLLAG